MTSARALAIAAVVSTAALALPLGAIAAPHLTGRTTAATAKPTGTIFYDHSTATGRIVTRSMPAKGGAAHTLPGTNQFLLPAASKHELVFTPLTSRGFVALDVATYKRTVTHSYPVKGIGELISVSPNGKYVGSVNTNSAGTKETYVIRTIKGTVVSTLMKTSADEDAVYEAWNAASTQVAVVSQNRKSELASLKIYSLHGKLVRTLATKVNGATYVAWSKTNTIAFADFTKVMVVKSTGGTPTTLFADTKDDLGVGLAYSPNGKFLTYGATPVNGPGAKVWIANADGTGRHVISNSGSLPRWG